MIRTTEERFWSKVDRSGECWLWTGNRNQFGYGRFHLNGSDRVAHRVAFELECGPVPAGKDLDHLCHVRNCVRPGHLRVATRKQNNENLLQPPKQ